MRHWLSGLPRHFRPLTVRNIGLAAVALGAAPACGEPTGSVGATLLVTAATAGVDPDIDGYTVVLDDQTGRPIARNATLTMVDLDPGEHRVALDGTAANCAVEGANPRTIGLTAGGTVSVRFYVTCAAVTGSLALHTRTTGDGRDPDGYLAVVDGGLRRHLAPNGDQTVSGLAAGEHRVDLTDVITNCRLDGEPAQTVSVRAGETADLLVSVACIGRSLHITATTTGPAPDADGYLVAVDSGAPQPIGVVGSLDVGGLIDGEHTVRLSGLASFCEAEENPRSVQVSESSPAVGFQVACPGPPTDGRLLFNGIAGAEVHVFAVHPDGSGQVDLTHAQGFAGKWSPDRSRVVFETTRSGDSEVFVMNADGTQQARLAAGRSPAWSPDGGRIAFINGNELTTVNADGSDRRVLLSSQRPESPSWSPDGRTIAFTSLNLGRCSLILFDLVCARDIHVVNVDGTDDRAVTHAQDAATFYHDPVWSPNGSTIAFWRSKFEAVGGGDLYLVAPDGTALVQLTATPDVDEAFPVWSPDGRALAFGTRTGTADFDLALIAREGGASFPLLSRPGEQLPTSWR